MEQPEKYYVDIGGKTAGPFSAREMAALYAEGTITDATLWCKPDGAEWLPVAIIKPLLESAKDKAAPPVRAGIPPPAVPGQFRCPYCSSTLPPIAKSEVSTVGWVVLLLLLLSGLLLACLIYPLLLCALCWLGLLIRDRYRMCASCGARLP